MEEGKELYEVLFLIDHKCDQYWNWIKSDGYIL